MWWADNSVRNWGKLPINNPKPDLHNINGLCTYQVWWKSTDIYSCSCPKTKIWPCGRQITLSKIDEICPLAIPNQLAKISLHIPSLVKIHWYLLKLWSGNENTEEQTYNKCTYRQADGQMDIQHETIISRLYRGVGYKKDSFPNMKFNNYLSRDKIFVQRVLNVWKEI